MNDASPTSLVRYDAMCRAIDAAHAASMRSKTSASLRLALETYAREAKNIDAIRLACETGCAPNAGPGNGSRKSRRQRAADRQKP